MAQHQVKETFKQPINHRVTIEKLNNAFLEYDINYEVDGDANCLLVTTHGNVWDD